MEMHYLFGYGAICLVGFILFVTVVWLIKSFVPREDDDKPVWMSLEDKNTPLGPKHTGRWHRQNDGLIPGIYLE